MGRGALMSRAELVVILLAVVTSRKDADISKDRQDPNIMDVLLLYLIFVVEERRGAGAGRSSAGGGGVSYMDMLIEFALSDSGTFSSYVCHR